MTNSTEHPKHCLKIILGFLLIFVSMQLSAQSYRYYRITLTGGNSLELGDVRWLNGGAENPSTNLTNGSAVTASNSGWWNVFDATRTSGTWIGAPTGSQFITVDLGAATAITGVKIQIASWSTLSGFVCAGSANNSTFTTIYTATGINQSGGTPVTYSINTSDIQAPTVPTGMASSNITQTGLTLNWSASTDNVGVTGYEVFRNGTSNGTPNTNTFAVTGLAASTTYSFTVRARDAAGNWSAVSSALSATTSAPPDTQAPTVPVGIASSNITQSGATLSWSASTDNISVTGYEVFRNGISIGTPTTTTFAATGLTASTTYSFTVRARDGAGNWSAVSTALSVSTSAAGGGGNATVTFTGLNNGSLANPYNDPSGYSFLGTFSSTGSPEPLVVYTIGGNKAVTNTNWISTITITRTAGGSFDLTSLKYASDPWGGLADATITGSLSGGGTVTANISASSLTFQTVILNWTNLQQVVINYTGGANGAFGLLDDVTFGTSAPDTQSPTVPTGLASSNITQTGASLNWSASTDNVGVTGYEVFRNGTSIGTPATSSFAVTGLTASTTYSFTVRARDAAGNWSAVSSALSVTTSAASDIQGPTVPTGLASSNITQTGASLNWSASTDNVGVTGYEVFRNGTSIGTPATSSFAVTGLTASTTYSFTVRARDAAGNWSGVSSALSVTTTGSSDTQAPTVPTALNATGISNTSFTLNWNASTDNVGVTGYEIFLNAVSKGTSSNTSFSVTGLTAATTYSVTTRARDAAGNWSALSSALSVTTSNGHVHTDPRHAQESLDMLNLVPVAAATHTAVNSGAWTNAQTWSGNVVPANNAKVIIPAGITVEINTQLTSRISTVRVSGVLKFSTSSSSQLLVETVVVPYGGLLEIGTAAQPVSANSIARIRFIDNGDLNFAADPKLLSRGLLSEGQVKIYGQWKTQFLKTTSFLPAGTTQITLQSTPVGWQVGDKIAISGLRYRTQNDGAEAFTITAISGAQITLSAPIQKTKIIEDNAPIFAGLYPYVANLTRNVILESEVSTPIRRRGHVMMMHNNSYEIQNAQFKDLGRTDKSIEFTKTPTSASSNMFGRYPLHFHRTGDEDKNVLPVLVKGCALDGSPGWGYVSHESHVNFEDNASYNVFGSHFVGENGTEIGGFYRNIAIFSQGSGDPTGEKNRTEGDHGHSGVGFWLTSGSLKVVDNVATDNSNAGYAIITRKTPVEAHDFYASNWDDPAVFGGLDKLEVERLALNTFKGNVSYASRGIHIIDMELNGMLNSNNLIEDFISLNAEGDFGLDLEYSRNLRLKNVKVLRDGQLYTDDYNGVYGIKMRNTWDHLFPFAVKSWSYLENVHIHGFLRGIDNADGFTTNDSKVYVLNNSLTTNLKSATIIRDARPEKFKYVNSADLLPRPVYSITPGFYNSGKNVTLSSGVSGTSIYYRVLQTNDDWRIYDCCELGASLFGQLTPGTVYTGQVISTAAFRWTVIVSYATKNGIISPISIAFYKNDPSLPQGRGYVSNGASSFELEFDDAKSGTDNKLMVYPNPVSGNVVTVVTGLKSGTIVFTDVSGRKTIQVPITAPRQDVSLKNIGKGIYIIQAIVNDKIIKTTKLLITR